MRSHRIRSASLPLQLFMDISIYWHEIIKDVKAKLANVQLFIFPLDQFSIEDHQSYCRNINTKKTCLIYKLSFMFIFAWHIFTFSGQSIIQRLAFCLAYLVVFANTFWILTKQCKAKIFYMLDCMLVLFLNACANKEHELTFSIINCSLYLSICFLSPCILENFLIAVFLSSFNAAFQKESTCFMENFILFMSFCIICLAVNKTNDIIASEYHKMLAFVKKKAETEIQNKTLFVASVSHDLKNPLNSLLGCIDMLKNSEDLKARDKKNLETASFSGQILHFLIGTILDIAKIETGKFALDCYPMNVNEEVKKILNLENELSKSKGIPLYKKVLWPLPKLVFGDPMRFAQILMNLIGNAIKFTSRGYVAIIVRWVRTIGEIKNPSTFPNQIFSQDEDNSEIIPPEDFFISNPRAKMPSASLPDNRPTASLFAKEEKITPLSDVTLEEFTEDINEDVTGVLNKIIAKYIDIPKSKGGKYSEEAMSLSRKARAFSSLSPIPYVIASGLPKQEETYSPSFGVTTTARQNNNSTLVFQAIRKRSESKDISFGEMENPKENEAVWQNGEKGVLIIEIIDTGPGMTKEEIDNLFQPFHQANNTIKSKYGGTGLGLWITKQIVQLMNGIIEVQSIPKKGTKFRVAIPLQIVKNEFCISPRLFANTKFGEIGTDSKLMLASFIAGPSGGFRVSGKEIFKGNNDLLKGIRILLIEDEHLHADSEIEQVLGQLKQTNSELFYTTYGSCLQTLEKGEFKFNSILLIATTPSEKTKKLLTAIEGFLLEKNVKKIKVLIALGKS